ncbi:hypothetical protein BSL78_05523 [Apostichopus japonicus]|uniref:Uncharacterized protein n=1 Tax=Stichopus japonicus TaxID=307972 RepID=A0A2G8LBN2_STIJA|nr:hypothetical protein BSL78_05523 [Apostichopus japonicus]
MLFAGIWFGNKKPCMGTFLEPFHSALKNIADGIKLKPFGFDNPINVHGILLGGTCDLPAKCIMLNMTQFNGQFGCGRCKQPGKHVPSGRGFTHVYPYDYEHIDGPKRTHEETKEAAISALSQGHSVDGVKGPSWFMFLGCDIIRGTAIDYMHQRPELQIANSIGAMLKFPSCVSNMSAPVIEFYYRVSNKRISPQKKKLVSPGVYVLGTPTIMSLDRDIIILLKDTVHNWMVIVTWYIKELCSVK